MLDQTTPYVKDNSVLETGIINPDAPVYEPEKWNDLGLDSNQNVDNFFQYLNRHHYNIIANLQAASLLSLGNVVAVADDISEYPYGNTNARRIKSVLNSEDYATLKATVIKFFNFQQTKANCYGYTLNFQKSYPGSKPDPGGMTKEYIAGIRSDFVAAITEGATEDRLIHAGSVLPPVKAGYYRAAMAVSEACTESAYHWLRETYNANFWTHKNGHSPVTNLDDNGVLITDLTKAVIGTYQVRQFFYVPRGGAKPTCLDAG